MIADVANSFPVEMAAWMACLAAFVGLMVGLLKISDRIRGKGVIDQPVRVVEEHNFAKERDCITRSQDAARQIEALRIERVQDVRAATVSREGLDREVKCVRDEIGQMERRLNTADEERTEKVHERINDILEAVGEIRGRLTT